MADIPHPLPANARSSAATGHGALIGAAIATVVCIAVQQFVIRLDVSLMADNGMRLVQVRDLLAGQGWFDVTQYRLGLDAGTAMHWSRLVDAPIAAIIRLTAAVTGDAALAETVAAHAWPALLLFLALWAVALACRRAGSDEAVVPGLVLAGIALAFRDPFQPGAFDHHNVQVVLGLWMIAALLDRAHPVRNHALAGLLAVLMLAVGMETLPYVAAAGAWVAAAFVTGAIGAPAARAFGLALPAAALAALFATVPPARYAEHACDAYSLFHVTMASIGGAGLAVTAGAGGFGRRLWGLAATGAVIGGLALTVFADCFEDPLASLDPHMIAFWLDMIVEAQSIADHWADDPFRLFGLFGLATSALTVAVVLAARGGVAPHTRAAMALCALMLVLAIAVTAWQQRASIFSTAFALVPMALLIVAARERHARKPSVPAIGLLLLAWVISINSTWWLMTMATTRAFDDQPPLEARMAQAQKDRPNCFDAAGIRRIAALDDAVLAAPFNAAVPILLGTGHRAIAGNYHRNAEGNLAWIALMTAPAVAAEPIARARGVTHIVSCANEPDPEMFVERAPGGLQAALVAGQAPAWLTRLPIEHDAPFAIYEVMDNR